jgi:hypothetical protein
LLGCLATLISVEQVLTGKTQEGSGIETRVASFGTPRLDIGKHGTARFEERDRAVEVKL